MADNIHHLFGTPDAPISQSRVVDGGGGPPHDSDMERRVASLEAKMDKVQDTLGSIQVTLARMEEKMVTKDDFSPIRADVAVVKTSLDAKATSASVAVLDERTNKLASTRGVAGMLALATAALALISKWSDVIGYFTHHP